MGTIRTTRWPMREVEEAGIRSRAIRLEAVEGISSISSMALAVEEGRSSIGDEQGSAGCTFEPCRCAEAYRSTTALAWVPSGRDRRESVVRRDR